VSEGNHNVVVLLVTGTWLHISWLCANVVSATERWWPVSLWCL